MFVSSFSYANRFDGWLQGEEATKEAALVKTYKGTLTFPDMTNSDVDNGRFDSEVRIRTGGYLETKESACSVALVLVRVGSNATVVTGATQR